MSLAMQLYSFKALIMHTYNYKKVLSSKSHITQETSTNATSSVYPGGDKCYCVVDGTTTKILPRHASAVQNGNT